MNENKWAIITGADGGMGTEITRAVAKAGYRVIMACYQPKKAELIRRCLMEDTGNQNLEVEPIDLSSMRSVVDFANRVLERRISVSLLMNNAGTMETGYHVTEDGFERTVSVNYLGPYLLTRKLISAMEKGTRVVNMVSCTHAIGRIDLPDFFHRGKKGDFWRIPIYSNTKLALLLFTLELADRLREKGIMVNAADPGVVSTDIITMHQWFDPLTDIFFRPFIRTPQKGASTAIGLLLDMQLAGVTGQLYASNKQQVLSDKYVHSVCRESLWKATEQVLSHWLCK
ncbi:short-chain dehydrogenase/reductase SDR [gut metagenome]|uniref:Short-chain dehydrogenase/reductase SDR n=1 Tax=gut metagenome TaxID=749906 RepID=J9D1Q0_9ZZZZ